MKSTEVNIGIDDTVFIKGQLNIPHDPNALVIFSHGSGSSRFSKRNKHVAEILNKSNIATLLVDLLSEEEDQVYENRFNINLLADRLVKVTKYATKLSDLRDLGVGYFGASTGAASALKAAVSLKGIIKAVVSRGGRPDLAGDSLRNVKAPTLLVVGSLDTTVVVLNQRAYSKLNCEKEIRIIEGASHLFEESGKLDEVAGLALNWFNRHLALNSVVLMK